MKKTHLILLVITAVMALFSAYSLAAINQVYSLEYEWYSQYDKCFKEEKRDTSLDRWMIDSYPNAMQFDIIADRIFAGAENTDKLEKPLVKVLKSQDYNEYVTIYCTLGELTSPEYRIKISDIAQRGNVVEVKVSINSPTDGVLADKNQEKKLEEKAYYPTDIVRIHKSTFSSKGGLYFIFKTQSGKQVFEKYLEIK